MPINSSVNVMGIKIALRFAAVMAMLLAFANLQAKSCLSYDRVVQLAGTLQQHIYPGPPGFESIKNGDQPLKYFRLKLISPVCATAPPSSAAYVSVKNVSIVQLVLDKNGYNKLRPFLGKVVKVKGKLFSPFDGYHQELLLLSDVALVEGDANNSSKWTR